MDLGNYALDFVAKIFLILETDGFQPRVNQQALNAQPVMNVAQSVLHLELTSVAVSNTLLLSQFSAMLF
jgi:hypothetical protein